MTRQEISKYFDKIDKSRYNTYIHDISYVFAMKDMWKGKYILSTNAKDRDIYNIIIFTAIYLFDTKLGKETLEDYVDRLGKDIIVAYDNNIFHAQDLTEFSSR